MSKENSKTTLHTKSNKIMKCVFTNLGTEHSVNWADGIVCSEERSIVEEDDV